MIRYVLTSLLLRVSPQAVTIYIQLLRAYVIEGPWKTWHRDCWFRTGNPTRSGRQNETGRFLKCLWTTFRWCQGKISHSCSSEGNSGAAAKQNKGPQHVLMSPTNCVRNRYCVYCEQDLPHTSPERQKVAFAKREAALNLFRTMRRLATNAWSLFLAVTARMKMHDITDQAFGLMSMLLVVAKKTERQPIAIPRQYRNFWINMSGKSAAKLIGKRERTYTNRKAQGRKRGTDSNNILEELLLVAGSSGTILVKKRPTEHATVIKTASPASRRVAAVILEDAFVHS